MANFAALSTVGEFERGAAAIAMMLQDPFLAFLDQHSAFELETTEFLYRPTTGTTTVKKRNRGGAYTPTAQTPSDQENGMLAFMGDALNIDMTDMADAQNAGSDLSGWIDKRLGKLFPAWVKALTPLMFNGSGAGTPREMTGLHTIFNGVDNIPGFAITGVIDAASFLSGAPDSFDLTDPDNWPAFARAMDIVTAQIDDLKGIALNKEMYGWVRTIARELNLLGSARNHLDQPLDTWGPYPLVKLRDGCITNTEEDNDTGTNTTSIDFLSPGEQRLSVATNSGLFWDEKIPMEAKESGQIKWETRMEWKVEEENAMRRMRNFYIG